MALAAESTGDASLDLGFIIPLPPMLPAAELCCDESIADVCICSTRQEKCEFENELDRVRIDEFPLQFLFLIFGVMFDMGSFD